MHCWIWRKQETRFHSSNIRRRDLYGGSRICIWDGVSLNERTHLIVFPCKTVNAHVYRYPILDAYLRLYAGVIGNDFLLQNDNARPHHTGFKSQKISFGTKQLNAWNDSSITGLELHRACLGCFMKMCRCSQSPSSDPSHVYDCFTRAMAHSSQ